MKDEKLVHSITVEVFKYPWEYDEKIEKAIFSVFPVKTKLNKENIESYTGSFIQKVTAKTVKTSEIRKIISHFMKNLSKEELKKITDSIEDRIDEEGNFFIRFSKQDACEDVLKLQYKGDIIKMRMKLTSYPFSIEKAKKNAVKIFETK